MNESREKFYLTNQREESGKNSVIKIHSKYFLPENGSEMNAENVGGNEHEESTKR